MDVCDVCVLSRVKPNAVGGEPDTVDSDELKQKRKKRKRKLEEESPREEESQPKEVEKALGSDDSALTKRDQKTTNPPAIGICHHFSLFSAAQLTSQSVMVQFRDTKQSGFGQSDYRLHFQ